LIPLLETTVSFDNVCSAKPPSKLTYRRYWSKYNKIVLFDRLATVDWSSNYDNVQSIWIDFESKILEDIYSLIPLLTFSEKSFTKKTLPASIKTSLHLRKMDQITEIYRKPSDKNKARSCEQNY
jgi:hypothetical protein